MRSPPRKPLAPRAFLALAALEVLACRGRRGADGGAGTATAQPPPGVPVLRWSDTAEASAGPNEGAQHRVFCPPNGTPGAVYGTDFYALRSSICTAAVHAGRITLAAGGVVDWYPWSVASRMAPSNHHGISSMEALREVAFTFTPYVPRHHRMFFELLRPLPVWSRQPVAPTEPLAWAPSPPVPPSVDPTPVPFDWSTNATRWVHEQGTIHSVSCPPRPRSLSRVIFGNETYSSDSAVCIAALHDGRIDDAGGTVTLEMRGPQASFPAVERNGIHSRSWQRWPGSFAFHGGGPRRPIVPTEPVPATWHSTASQLRGMVGTEVRFVCPPGGQLEPLWGGGEGSPFSEDSSVCTAGVFAGAATFQAGGVVHLRMVAAPNVFAVGDQNDVWTGLTFGGRDRAGFVIVRP